jgi:acyl carrier protein
VPAETHVNRGPIDPDEVVRLVCERLAEILGVDDEAVTLDASLAADLGVDDLALLELAEIIERELGERTVGVAIDDEDLADFETVGDIVDYVVNLVAPVPAPDPGVPDVTDGPASDARARDGEHR